MVEYLELHAVEADEAVNVASPDTVPRLRDRVDGVLRKTFRFLPQIVPVQSDRKCRIRASLCRWPKSRYDKHRGQRIP